MGLGVDVGVDTQADRRTDSQRSGHFVQALEFGRRFDVEAEDAGRESESHFLSGFSDAGKNDFSRVGAGGQCALEFPGGNDVEPGASAGEDVEYCQVGIGLDRIADLGVDAIQFDKEFIQSRFKRCA